MASLTWDDLTINPSHLDINDLIESWGWLIAKDVNPILITALGDIFFQRSSGEVLWLDTGSAKITVVAKSSDEFKANLSNSEIIDEWFLPKLIGELKSSGKILESGQVYSYDHPPNLGGDYTVDNIRPAALSVHLFIHGQIGEQIKDLSDGASAIIEIVD